MGFVKLRGRSVHGKEHVKVILRVVLVMLPYVEYIAMFLRLRIVQESTVFLKIDEPVQNSRCQKGNMRLDPIPRTHKY